MLVQGMDYYIEGLTVPPFMRTTPLLRGSGFSFMLLDTVYSLYILLGSTRKLTMAFSD